MMMQNTQVFSYESPTNSPRIDETKIMRAPKKACYFNEDNDSNYFIDTSSFDTHINEISKGNIIISGFDATDNCTDFLGDNSTNCSSTSSQEPSSPKVTPFRF